MQTVITSYSIHYTKLYDDRVGETMYYGPGAGGDATASAVIANIIDIARRGKGSPMLGFRNNFV